MSDIYAQKRGSISKKLEQKKVSGRAASSSSRYTRTGL